MGNTCENNIVCTPQLGGVVGILEFWVFGGGQNIFNFTGGGGGGAGLGLSYEGELYFLGGVQFIQFCFHFKY